MNERPSEINGMKPTAMFHVRHGKVLFHKTDFHPLGELDLYRPVFYQYSVDEIFNACREGYNDYWYLPSKKDSFTPDLRTHTPPTNAEFSATSLLPNEATASRIPRCRSSTTLQTGMSPTAPMSPTSKPFLPTNASGFSFGRNDALEK